MSSLRYTVISPVHKVHGNVGKSHSRTEGEINILKSCVVFYNDMVNEPAQCSCIVSEGIILVQLSVVSLF